MSYMDDLADEIRLMAGKATGEANVVARGALVDVISDINDRASSEVIKSRAQFTMTGGSYSPIEMPNNCRRIIELGEYDATTLRIKNPYIEKSEEEFHQLTAGETLSTLETDQRYYMIVDRSSNSMSTGNELRLQIKVWPVPGSTLTGLVRFFVPLTEDNADRLGNRFMLKNGAIALLAEWFPKKAELNWKIYLDAVETYKRAHASTVRTGARQVPNNIIRHNAIMRGLVN